MTGATTLDTTGSIGTVITVRDFSHTVWNFLAVEGAIVEYPLQGMTVELPRTTGPGLPPAAWTMDGTLGARAHDASGSRSA